MNVLYVNHTGKLGGGERSLLLLLENLPAEVEPVLACPSGPLEDAARALGLPTHRIPGTDGSLRLHPWHTSRAIAELGAGAVVVARLARRGEVDVVHANSVRAGVVASLAATLGAPPPIVHVRDCLPRGRAADAALRVIAARARAVIANSAYTAATLARPGVQVVPNVVPNAVDLRRFAPTTEPRPALRAALGLPPAPAALAVVAQLTPWKAQDDAVRALARLREGGHDVQLLLAGSAKFASRATRFDNRDYVRRLEALVQECGVSDRVYFLGERDDVPALLGATDVALVPSWEEPFGRVVVEAMASGVPVVATQIGGPAEIVRDGIDGLLLEPRRPETWADAIAGLLADTAGWAAMAQAGRARAVSEYGVASHVERILAVYRSSIGVAPAPITGGASGAGSTTTDPGSPGAGR